MFKLPFGNQKGKDSEWTVFKSLSIFSFSSPLSARTLPQFGWQEPLHYSRLNNIVIYLEFC